MAGSDAGVRIDRGAVSWAATSGVRHFLVFEPHDGSPTALTDIQHAVEIANRAADADDPVVGGCVVPVESGIMFAFERTGTTQARKHWLTAFADTLAQTGQRGAITRPVRRFPDDGAQSRLHAARPLSLFLAYRSQAACIRHIAALRGAYSDGVSTAWVGAYHTGFPLPVGRSEQSMLVDQFLQEYLRSPLSTVSTLLTGPDVLAETSWGDTHAVARRIDPSVWETDVRRARAQLVRQAPALDYGQVRTAQSYCTWPTLQQAEPHPPAGEDAVFFYQRLPKWPDRVADAHGIQILTKTRVERAHDLSDWKVDDLGDDRYLVESKDPEAWFAQPFPDPDALDQARRDFGSLIVTAEDVRKRRAGREA